MLTLNDGRKEMYQWDIGRIATIDVECDVVHFSNLKYGASLAVEVKNGEVAIPNKLLTSGEQIYCWAFVADENGNYTKQEQTLNVNKRAKPSDYVYTETETLTWKSLDDKINDLGESTANSVKYTEQELTDEQKAQARANIGAVSVGEVPKQVQTDWNQYNRDYPDYVKNRTHYTIVAHNSGYRADLMDSTHNIGDIVLLRAIPMSILDSLFIPGINASYRSEYSFHIVFKITFYEGTDVYESENDKECIANEEMEISEFSTGNIKVLYHNKRLPSIALYIIYDLTTLNDEDKTKFAKTGIYAQLVSLNTYDTATSILVGYRSIKYKKLHSKYIDIPVATNDVAGVVKPVSKTDGMTQPVGVDENGVLFTVPPGGSGDMQKSVYDPNNNAKDVYKYADDISKLAVTNHALSDTTHADIRELITGLTNRLNSLADSDDETLDQLSEIVAYIKSNKNLIDAITTNKVSVSDIVDNLTSSATNKPLSAAQGKALKTLIDAITEKNYIPSTGGTVTGKIVFPTGNQNAGIANTSDQKIFGYGLYNDINYMRLGDPTYPIQIRGNGERPKYNDSDLALMSDVETALGSYITDIDTIIGGGT